MRCAAGETSLKLSAPFRPPQSSGAQTLFIGPRLRAGLRNFCPVTGKALAGWVSVMADDALRSEIEAWARLQQLDFEALTAAKYKAPASTCRCGLVAPACACSSPVRPASELAPMNPKPQPLKAEVLPATMCKRPYAAAWWPLSWECAVPLRPGWG